MEGVRTRLASRFDRSFTQETQSGVLLQRVGQRDRGEGHRVVRTDGPHLRMGDDDTVDRALNRYYPATKEKANNIKDYVAFYKVCRDRTPNPWLLTRQTLARR